MGAELHTAETGDSPSGPEQEGRLRHLARLFFGFELPVGRKVYALTGFSLMLLKFLFDAWLIFKATTVTWMPWDYLNPLIARRLDLFPGAGESPLFWVLITTTIPFLWIGAAMTVRRSRDAGLPAELGLLFFVPFANYLAMLVFCVLPSRAKSPAEAEPGTLLPKRRGFLESALFGSLAGTAFAVAMVVLSVSLLGSYGSALFVGSPFVVAAVAAYVLERRTGATGLQAQGVGQLAIVLAGLTFLLFAFEGIFCLVVAWPLAALMAIPGAWLGRHVGRLPPRSLEPVSPLWVLVLAWPLLVAVESPKAPLPLRAVSTSITIDAPPELVWESVVAFPELPPPNELIFLLGIAYPQRARIEGQGVGAVRYCEFSTGPFVEPITVWDPPRQLSFDVAAQPKPMRELSPYQVDAPHLDGFLQSRRGEFLLRESDTGGTIVVGTTWYEVQIFPQVYWQLYADAIIHAIHGRVLEHIERTSMAQKPTWKPKYINAPL